MTVADGTSTPAIASVLLAGLSCSFFFYAKHCTRKDVHRAPALVRESQSVDC